MEHKTTRFIVGHVYLSSCGHPVEIVKIEDGALYYSYLFCGMYPLRMCPKEEADIHKAVLAFNDVTLPESYQLAFIKNWKHSEYPDPFCSLDSRKEWNYIVNTYDGPRSVKEYFVEE